MRRLAAQRATQVAKMKEEKRKRDTRRKILLGAALIRLLRTNDAQARAVLAKATSRMKASDRRLFEDSEFEADLAADAATDAG